MNPFAKRDEQTAGSVTTYKVLTILSWLLSVVVSFYYSTHIPEDGYSFRRRIWDMNEIYRTAFTMNSIIAEIYW